MLRYIESELLAFVVFAPVLGLEIAASLHFAGRGYSMRALRSLPRRERMALAARQVFWLLAFAIWVVICGRLSRTLPFRWIMFVGPRIDVNVRLVLYGMGIYSYVAALVATAFWWRFASWRLTSTLFVPGALGLALFWHFYEYGGPGGAVSEAALTSQPGVTLVYRSDLGQAHPRDICVDPDRDELLVTYGCTACPIEDPMPGVVRVDLATGTTQTFISGPVREIDCNNASRELPIAPWLDQRVIVLDRDDLSVVRELRPEWRGQIDIWEPMAILEDPSVGRYFVTNDVTQGVMALDAQTGAWLGHHDFWQEGRVTLYGLPAYSMVQGHPGGPVYFTSGPGENLYALDPASLEILRAARLDDLAGTGLALDEDNDRLWYQSSFDDRLLEIRASDFTVIRDLGGERYARGLVYDPGRERLYLLGYMSGTLRAIDLATGSTLWTLRVGGRPNAMEMAGDALWLNSMAGVLRVDLQGR